MKFFFILCDFIIKKKTIKKTFKHTHALLTIYIYIYISFFFSFLSFLFFFYIHNTKFKFKTIKQKLHYNYNNSPKTIWNYREALLQAGIVLRKVSGRKNSGGASPPRATATDGVWVHALPHKRQANGWVLLNFFSSSLPCWWWGPPSPVKEETHTNTQLILSFSFCADPFSDLLFCSCCSFLLLQNGSSNDWGRSAGGRRCPGEASVLMEIKRSGKMERRPARGESKGRRLCPLFGLGEPAAGEGSSWEGKMTRIGGLLDLRRRLAKQRATVGWERGTWWGAEVAGGSLSTAAFLWLVLRAKPKEGGGDLSMLNREEKPGGRLGRRRRFFFWQGVAACGCLGE